MLGILVALFVSWLLLYFFERKNILALGFLPIEERLKQFITGFLISLILCIAVQFLESLLTSSKWVLNEKYNSAHILNKVWWDLKSVLTEELIFRGALLYIFIKRIGVEKALLISGAAFGIYHWFSFQIFGNIIPMFFVFVGTGLMGYVWALAFSKTGSIFMPLGFHLGWNTTFNTFFSKGPSGDGLLILKEGNTVNNYYSLITLWLLPVIVLIIVKYFIPAKNNEVIKRKVTKPEKLR